MSLHETASVLKVLNSRIILHEKFDHNKPNR